MGFNEQAIADTKRILGNTDEWAKPVQFTTKAGVIPEVTVEIAGTSSIHSISYDTMGNMVNGRNVHVTVHEEALTDAGFTTRNADGKVALKGCIVVTADNTGTDYTFIIKETQPDNTLGNIVCILGDYDNA